MQSFDITLMNLYLNGVLWLAAFAVVLSLGMATTEVVRSRRRPAVSVSDPARGPMSANAPDASRATVESA
jgi:hypothetical protein